MNNVDLIFVIEAIVFLLLLVPTCISFFTGAPWVPTPAVRAKKMVALANLKAGQVVYDIGCGDGRLVQYASKVHKVEAIGFELSPLVYAVAKVRNFILGARSKILLRDFRYQDLGKADVIFCYLLPDTLKKLKTKLEAELRPGAKLISYAFDVAGWEPTYIEPRNREKNLARILIYEMGLTAPHLRQGSGGLRQVKVKKKPAHTAAQPKRGPSKAKSGK